MRYQLPAYSPLTFGGVMRSAARAALSPEGVRQDLRDYLQQRFGAERALPLDSGTHALQVALTIALRQAPPDRRRLALPAYSCFDMATAAVAVGVPLMFYDVDPLTLCPEPSSFRRALGAGAGVVVAANLYGFPLHWTEIRREADHAEAFLVEDAAQGIGTSWGSDIGGSFGDLTVLSFGRGKGWTGGGGGALLSRGRGTLALDTAPEQFNRSRGSIRSALLALAQWLLGRPEFYWIPSAIPALRLGETLYREPTPPAGMSAFAAGAVAVHADMAKREAEVRRASAGRWLDRIESRCPEAAKQLCRPVAGGAATYLRLPLLATDEGEARRLARDGRRCGVARGYPLPLRDLAELSAQRVREGSPTPGARILAERLITLPTHSRTQPRDVERVCTSLQAAMSSPW